jgi:hypothetical protein
MRNLVGSSLVFLLAAVLLFQPSTVFANNSQGLDMGLSDSFEDQVEYLKSNSLWLWKETGMSIERNSGIYTKVMRKTASTAELILVYIESLEVLMELEKQSRDPDKSRRQIAEWIEKARRALTEHQTTFRAFLASLNLSEDEYRLSLASDELIVRVDTLLANVLTIYGLPAPAGTASPSPNAPGGP